MDLLLISLLAWFLFLVVASLATSLTHRLFGSSIRGLHPQSRASILRFICVAPVTLATLALGLCFAPKLLGRRFPELDHCAGHGGGHPHFCFQHAPDLEVASGVWIALVLGGALLLGVALRRVHEIRASMRVLRQLTTTARFDAHLGAWIVDTEQPVAVSVGLRRSRILLSVGLLSRVPHRMVAAIVAHERAHERRRDGLWKFCTEWLSHGHLPATRRRLRDDLELACEQACDEAAGAALGNRLGVAEALLAVERLRHQFLATGHGAMAFGANQLTERIESLTADSAGHRADPRWAILLVVLLLAAAVLVADPLHHFTETLIHRLWH